MKEICLYVTCTVFNFGQIVSYANIRISNFKPSGDPIADFDRVSKCVVEYINSADYTYTGYGITNIINLNNVFS